MRRGAAGVREEDAVDPSAFEYDLAENREGELGISLAEAEEEGPERLELGEEEVVGDDSREELDLLLRLHWIWGSRVRASNR